MEISDEVQWFWQTFGYLPEKWMQEIEFNKTSDEFEAFCCSIPKIENDDKTVSSIVHLDSKMFDDTTELEWLPDDLLKYVLREVIIEDLCEELGLFSDNKEDLREEIRKMTVEELQQTYPNAKVFRKSLVDIFREMMINDYESSRSRYCSLPYVTLAYGVITPENWELIPENWKQTFAKVWDVENEDNVLKSIIELQNQLFQDVIDQYDYELEIVEGLIQDI